jgi:hypothetical protein
VPSQLGFDELDASHRARSIRGNLLRASPGYRASEQPIIKLSQNGLYKLSGRHGQKHKRQKKHTAAAPATVDKMQATADTTTAEPEQILSQFDDQYGEAPSQALT